MKTITITVTNEEQDIFARARGYQDEILDEATEEMIPQDIDAFTAKIINDIIKLESITYLQKSAHVQAQAQVAPTIQAIQEKDINISITEEVTV